MPRASFHPALRAPPELRKPGLPCADLQVHLGTTPLPLLFNWSLSGHFLSELGYTETALLCGAGEAVAGRAREDSLLHPLFTPWHLCFGLAACS